MCADLQKLVRMKLAESGRRLVEVTRQEGLDYGRVQRILGGYVQPREGEVELLLDAIGSEEE